MQDLKNAIIIYMDEQNLDEKLDSVQLDETPLDKTESLTVHKSRHRWGRIILFLILSVSGLFTIGCFAATKNMDEMAKRRPVDLPKSFCETMDEEAPTIALNGVETLYIKRGGSYDEPGAVASDSCDIVEIMISGEVDTNTVGDYVIKYQSMDNSENITTATRTVHVVPEWYGTIFLTFDDGPWTDTNRLLDILKKYNVKATFFVTGNGDDAVIKREYDEGHTVALHTWSHDYSYVYSSVENYFNDLALIQNRVKNITGYTPTLIRFPGGSSNTVSRRYDGGTHIMSTLVQEVTKRGFTYFDWNISSGDAGSTTIPYEVYLNVINNLKPNDASVVLQHDSKNFSIDAVEAIIQYGLSNGYTFDRLTTDSPTAHHPVNN